MRDFDHRLERIEHHLSIPPVAIRPLASNNSYFSGGENFYTLA